MNALLDQVKKLSDDERAVFFQKAFEQMTIGQVLPLVKHLEAEWDVEAKPSFGGVSQQPQQEEESKEQSEFDVIVTNCGQKRMDVIKMVRTLTGKSLIESRNLLKELPATVLSRVSKTDADVAEDRLKTAGAEVEVK